MGRGCVRRLGARRYTILWFFSYCFSCSLHGTTLMVFDVGHADWFVRKASLAWPRGSAKG